MINRELKELLEVLDEIKKEMFKEEKKYSFSGWEKSRKKVKERLKKPPEFIDLTARQDG